MRARATDGAPPDRARETTAAPRFAGGRVAAGFVLAGLLAACGGDDGPSPTSAEALAHATYLTEATEGGHVTLENGERRFPPGGPVSGITLVASGEGDLDGDGDADAAAILVEERGMDRILRLHALLADDDTVQDVATRMIGDRFAVRSVSVVDGLIDVDLLTRRPDAPVTTPPTVPTRLRFALTGRGLLPVNPPMPRDADVATVRRVPTLISNQWNLTRAEVREWSADAGAFRQAPYLRFAEELSNGETITGSVSGQTGCNRLFGSFEAGAAGSMRVRNLATTRRDCGRGAMDRERRLVAALEAATGYTLAGDTLEIELDGGHVRFEAGPELAPPEPPQDLEGELLPDDATGSRERDARPRA